MDSIIKERDALLNINHQLRAERDSAIMEKELTRKDLELAKVKYEHDLRLQKIEANYRRSWWDRV